MAGGGLGGIGDRVVDRLFGGLISRRVGQAVKVIDDEYWSQVSGGAPTLDDDWTAKRENLDDALEAWRTNPLARRIVSLTSDYVLGSGVRVLSEHEWVQHFLDEWWDLNRMAERVYEWCDELTRCGEIFVVLNSEDVSGMTVVRALPAIRMDKIETDVGDLELEKRYHELVSGEFEGRWWTAARLDPSVSPGMLHYAINRPVGCVRGDGDLTPCLSWLRRYRDWLENRVRLNKYKTAFLWDVTIQGRPGFGDTLRKKRFKYKSAPEPGSIIVHDDAETWQAVSPKIEAWDAKEDGKAIRLMVAAGAGIPLHFLSEGESATKATAAEMGDPTFRHYYRRQLAFGALLEDLATIVVRRANARGRGKTFGDLKLSVRFPDITKSDNQAIAQSALLMVRALDQMANHGWIDDQSAITLAMQFAGELVNVEQVMERIKTVGPAKPVLPRGAPGGGDDEGKPVGAAVGVGETAGDQAGEGGRAAV